VSNNAITCYFLDVGQGASQVIHLGKQRAIVIDTGRHQTRSRSPLLTLLSELDIKTIEALILSHNDTDHIGDLCDILTTFGKGIRHAYYLADAHTERTNNIFKNKENIEVHRLEYDEKTKAIFEDRTAQIEVAVLYPAFENNLSATSSNNTSAIVLLSVGTQRIVFSGDAPVNAWKVIVDKKGQLSLQILTVPHHGSGLFCDNDTDLDWFHLNVKTKYAIVSVGYNNTYNHPNPNIIKSFAIQNTEIFCTQSNTGCNPNSTICCGTVIADINTTNTKIRNETDLNRRKEQNQQRLCLHNN
jgi:competence protein ComEC